METESTGTFGGEGERSPEEIERSLAGTRAAIESTVEELGERLRPGQMAEDARSYVREKAAQSASEVWRSTLRVVRENPVPIGLLGGGIVALLAAGRGGDEGRDRYLGYRRKRSYNFLGRRRSGMSTWLEGAGERAGEVGAQMADRGAQVAERARALLETDAASRAQLQARQVRQGLETLLAEQPLLLGFAGFALGALLGRSSRS
jgi:Protein of unknown function (DUF3618)